MGKRKLLFRGTGTALVTPFKRDGSVDEVVLRELVDRQMDAARLLGIRYHAGRGANTLPKAEGSTAP